jgi:DNA-binding transcriptional LysR family regulator
MLKWHVMDTELLAVFRAVARLGSFTAAAAELGYTQSAVSRQVSALETEFGVTLFDRQPRGVRLTGAGVSLLPHAEAVAGRLTLARDDLTALREMSAGRLRVGAFPTANTRLVPVAVSDFESAHPGVQLVLNEGLIRDLTHALRAGDLDVAVVTSNDATDGLDLRHILDDPMLVAMHPGHRLAGCEVVRLAELADEDWIAGSDRFDQTLLNGAPFTPRIRYVIREWVAKQGFVAAGLGITMVPSLAVGSARPDVVLVPLHPRDSPVRRIYAATPPGITAPPSLPAFIDCLDRAAATLALLLGPVPLGLALLLGPVACAGRLRLPQHRQGRPATGRLDLVGQHRTGQ